jgi:hypothetical protein
MASCAGRILTLLDLGLENKTEKSFNPEHPLLSVALHTLPPPAELSDLQDPEGAAQTTVALLSQKAPERNLQQFLDNKIAGGLPKLL